jgi:hypothetical protein
MHATCHTNLILLDLITQIIFCEHTSYEAAHYAVFSTSSLLGGLEVNTEKTKYVVMSCHQNAGQNHHFLTANKSLKNVTKFKYLEQQQYIKITFMKKLRAD